MKFIHSHSFHFGHQITLKLLPATAAGMICVMSAQKELRQRPEREGDGRIFQEGTQCKKIENERFEKWSMENVQKRRERRLKKLRKSTNFEERIGSYLHTRTRTHNITIKRTKEDLAAEHDGKDAKLNSQCSFRCDAICDAIRPHTTIHVSAHTKAVKPQKWWFPKKKVIIFERIENKGMNENEKMK